MGIISTFRALGVINKATKFVKNHKGTSTQVKALVAEIQDAIRFLEEYQDIYQICIDKAEASIKKLKGIINR